MRTRLLLLLGCALCLEAAASVRDARVTNVSWPSCSGSPPAVTTFGPESEWVYVWWWIPGTDLSVAGDTFVAQFIDPAGRVRFRSLEHGPLYHSDNPHDRWCFPLGWRISDTALEYLPGTWRAQILMNGSLVASVPFRMAWTPRPRQLKNARMSPGPMPACGVTTPPPAAGSFSTTAPRAYFWADVEGVREGDALSFLWYRPDGKPYPQNEPFYTATTAFGHWCYWYALDIAGTPAASRVGRWSAVVVWNGAVTVVPFMIISGGAGTTITTNPGSLRFAAERGDGLLTPQTIAVDVVPGMRVRAAGSAPWLVVRPATIATPGTFQVNADVTGMAPGDYSADVVLTYPDTGGFQARVRVDLSIGPGRDPTLAVGSPSLALYLRQNAPPAGVALNVLNLGRGTLQFGATAGTSSGGNWLAVSPASGQASRAAPATLLVTASPGALPPGTYSGWIALTAGAQSLTVPVTMTITASEGRILLSQEGLRFTSIAGGPAPAPQSFGVLNMGRDAMPWTARAVTLDGGSWLQVNPPAGTVVRPEQDVSMLEVSVNPSGAAPGEHYGRIEVSAATNNSPQIVTVIWTVLPEASPPPGPELRPTGLILTGAQGTSPAPREITINNISTRLATFVSTHQTYDGGDWLSHSPLYGVMLSGQSVHMVVQANFQGLAPGVYQGAITVQFSDGRSLTVPVLAVVTPGGGGGAGARYASACTTGNLQALFTSLQDGFTAVIGQPVAVEVAVVDECGNALAPQDGEVTLVIARFSNGDPDLHLIHTGNGVWAGTWRPVNSSASPVIVKVRAASFQSGILTRAGEVALQGSLESGSTPLAVAMVHSATFAPGAPVAPGGMVSLFGANLAPTASAAATLPLPLALGNTEVLLRGRPMPLLYAGPGQINALVPFDLPVNEPQQVVVRRGTALSVPTTVTLAAAQPGVFSKNMQGSGQGIILTSENQLAEPGNPARRGDWVVIYCAGLGAVNPPVDAGSPAPIPPAQTVEPVSVSIGGVPAQVLFSGLTPGLAGLYQVNVVVPPNAPTGDAVEVVLTAGGQTSRPVTIAVR